MSREIQEEIEDEANKARIAEGEGERAKERERVEREERKFRKLTVEEEIKIARMIEEKQEKKEDLIEIRIVRKYFLEGSISI